MIIVITLSVIGVAGGVAMMIYGGIAMSREAKSLVKFRRLMQEELDALERK